jgi:hypothetical protein
VIAAVDDSGPDWFELSAMLDQLLVPIMPPDFNFGQSCSRSADLFGGSDHLRASGNHFISVLIHTPTVKQNDVFLRPLLRSGDGYRNSIA